MGTDRELRPEVRGEHCAGDIQGYSLLRHEDVLRPCA